MSTSTPKPSTRLDLLTAQYDTSYGYFSQRLEGLAEDEAHHDQPHDQSDH